MMRPRILLRTAKTILVAGHETGGGYRYGSGKPPPARNSPESWSRASISGASPSLPTARRCSWAARTPSSNTIATAANSWVASPKAVTVPLPCPPTATGWRPIPMPVRENSELRSDDPSPGNRYRQERRRAQGTTRAPFNQLPMEPRTASDSCPPVTAVNLNANGVTSKIQGSICVWDVATGKKLNDLPNEYHSNVALASGRPNRGHTRIRNFQGTRVVVVNVLTGRTICTFKGGSSLEFTPDSRALIAVDFYRHPTVNLLWDATTGKELRRFQGQLEGGGGRQHRGWRQQLPVFSADGKSLLAVLAGDLEAGRLSSCSGTSPPGKPAPSTRRSF